MPNTNDRRETFAISDHHATSYSAAEILGSEHDRVSYHGKNGWFVARWQAIAIGVIVFVMLVIASFMGRSTDKSHHEYQRSNMGLYWPNSKVEIQPVTPVKAPLISVHTNVTTRSTNTMRHLAEPLNYVIYIQPDITPNHKNDKFTFSGNVSITLHVKEELQYLAIGASDLRIISTKMNKIKNATYNAVHQIEGIIEMSIDSYDVNEGTLNFELFDWLVPDQLYELIIEFNGNLQTLPYGLFRSSYQDEVTGENKSIIGTNLDVPFARTVFPCFDAPTQTATFQLNIARPPFMKVQATTSYWHFLEAPDEWAWERYLKTSPMPVHSLAFVVNDFENEYRVTPQISHYSIWTVSKRTEELNYVLDLGPLLIKNIESYLNVALPVKKINIYGLPQILPRQTAKIGMIYIQESDLIVKEERTSDEHKQSVAQIMAGHMIEQWLENLIMFQWRSDDWIKQAITQYFEYTLLKFVEPSWKTIEHFFVKVQQLEMDREMDNPNHKARYVRWIPYIDESNTQFLFPINETTVFRSTELDEVTDVMNRLSTSKSTKPRIYTQLFERKATDRGACMIRMIQHIVTEPLFIASLRIFMENSRGKVVNGNDLWDIMTTQTASAEYPGYQLLPESISLQTVLEDWIYTDGYPLITVIRDYDNNTIRFSQYVDIEIGILSPRSKRLNLWHVPISYTTQTEKFFTATAPRFWLNKVHSVDIITPEDLKNSQWLLVNPQQTNFYRVHYDMENWRLLKQALSNGEFPEIVRAQLIDDVLFLGRKGRIDYKFALDFTIYLGGYKEQEYIVWYTVLRHFNYIRNILAETSIESALRYIDNEIKTALKVPDVPEPDHIQKFKIYMRWLITTPFNNLNSKWTESRNLEHNDRLLRSDIFLWACAMGISECNTIARSELDNWKNSRSPDSENPIEPDMRYAILCSAMRIGGTSDYDFLLNRYQNTPDNSPEKRIYLKSLYCFESEKHYKTFLSTTLNEDFSVNNLHEIDMIWSTIPQCFYVSKVPFDFLYDNWGDIKTRFSAFRTIMKTIVEAAVSNIYSMSQIDNLKDLKSSSINDLPYLEHTFDDALRNLADREKWRKFEMKKFFAWLNETIEKKITPFGIIAGEIDHQINHNIH